MTGWQLLCYIFTLGCATLHKWNSVSRMGYSLLPSFSAAHSFPLQVLPLGFRDSPETVLGKMWHYKVKEDIMML